MECYSKGSKLKEKKSAERKKSAEETEKLVRSVWTAEAPT